VISAENARSAAKRLLAMDDGDLVEAFDALDPAIAVYIVQKADTPDRRSDAALFGELCARLAIESL
jgi:hypothetical protein